METRNKWYLAEIVLLLTNKSRGTTRAHVNFVIVEASSVEDAYNRAVELGSIESNTLENQGGDLIRVEYRGLKNLHRIYEPTLSHGAELLYEELDDFDENNIHTLVRSKYQLNVFAEPADQP